MSVVHTCFCATMATSSSVGDGVAHKSKIQEKAVDPYNRGLRGPTCSGSRIWGKEGTTDPVRKPTSIPLTRETSLTVYISGDSDGNLICLQKWGKDNENNLQRAGSLLTYRCIMETYGSTSR